MLQPWIKNQGMKCMAVAKNTPSQINLQFHPGMNGPAMANINTNSKAKET